MTIHDIVSRRRPSTHPTHRRTRRDRLVAITVARCMLFLLAWQAARAGELVVGQTLSLTGPSAAIAKDLLRGRQACADYVNAHGGIRGNTLKLVTRDDQGDPARAVRMDREMVDRDGAVVMLGAMGPAINAAVLGWAEATGIVMIAPYGGDIESRASNADTAYFLTANQSAEAERLARHIASLGFSRVVLVHAADKAGNAAMVALEEGLGENNVSASEVVSVRPDGGDAAAAAAQVYKTNAQAVLLATSGRATVAMLHSLVAESASGMPLLQVYGLSSAASQAELLELGGRARGFSMSQVIPLPRDRSVPLVATFLAAMRREPGERTYPELEGCIAPLVLAEVMRHKSAEASRVGILKAMQAAGRVDLGGFEIDLANRHKSGSTFTDIVFVGSDGRIAR